MDVLGHGRTSPKSSSVPCHPRPPRRLKAFRATIRESLRQGVRGPRLNLALMISPWNFQLGETPVPATPLKESRESAFPTAGLARRILTRVPCDCVPETAEEVHPTSPMVLDDIRRDPPMRKPENRLATVLIQVDLDRTRLRR
jgi:hypothetical protein